MVSWDPLPLCEIFQGFATAFVQFSGVQDYIRNQQQNHHCHLWTFTICVLHHHPHLLSVCERGFPVAAAASGYLRCYVSGEVGSWVSVVPQRGRHLHDTQIFTNTFFDAMISPQNAKIICSSSDLEINQTLQQNDTLLTIVIERPQLFHLTSLNYCCKWVYAYPLHWASVMSVGGTHKTLKAGFSSLLPIDAIISPQNTPSGLVINQTTALGNCYNINVSVRHSQDTQG